MKGTQFIRGKKNSSASVKVQVSSQNHLRSEGKSPALEERLKFSFSGSKRLGEKIERARGLLSNKYPKGPGFEQIFEEALDLYIARNDLTVKPKRRRCAPVKEDSRYIPASVKAEVYLRDGG